MDKFNKFLLNTSPLPQKSFEKLNKLVTFNTYKAKQNLYELEKIPTKVYFLESGIAKSYLILDNGNEYINRIHTAGELMGPLASLIKTKPAKFAVECITDCIVAECDYNQFIKLAEDDINIGIFHRKYLELIYISYTKRIAEFLALNSTERYLKLKKHIPNIDQLINQKLIASHLAITPIQLSRIRKKLAINHDLIL